MSKRRPGLKPRERDDRPTPWPAVLPLLRHLRPPTKFVEPCRGGGELINWAMRRALKKLGGSKEKVGFQGPWIWELPQ